MKILQIGAGRWGSNHLRIWIGLNVDLYVAESTEEGRQACINAGVPEDHVTDDYRNFLDIVSAVDVVTPASTHYRLGIECLEKGKDVFMEKPIAETAEDALRLASVASAGTSIFQPGHIFRYDPAAEFVKDYIAGGRIGAIYNLTGSFYGFKRPRTDGGVAISDAIHFIDFFNYLMGGLPRTVHARCSDILGRGMDDMSWIWMRYGRTSAVVEANYFFPEKKRSIIVIGEDQTIVCDFASSQDKVTIYRNCHIQDNNTWRTMSGEVVHQEVLPAEPLLLELKDFLRCVEARSMPRANAQDGADAVRVVEAAIESDRLGREINL